MSGASAPQVRLSTFLAWSIASSVYMLVYFNSWGMPVWQFVLGIISASAISLVAEILSALFLTKGRSQPVSRSRWLRDYALAGGIGSAVLIAALEGVGLGQGRAVAVMFVVILTGIINTWLFGYAIDEIMSYRRSASKARDELLPRLRVVRAVNEHLASADHAADNRERDVIDSEINLPLRKLRDSVANSEDVQGAAEVESFIADVLRPLAHHMHPITPDLGLVRAVEAAGYRVTAQPVVMELDATGELLDNDVRIETYRWIAESSHHAPGPVQVDLQLGERTLTVELTGARGNPLDPLQLTAGLTAESASDNPTRLIVPLRGQVAQQFLAASDAGPSRSNRREFPLREWLWRGDSAKPSIPLVAALTFTAIPASTFIANPSITRSTALAIAATWIVVPVTLAWVLGRVRLRSTRALQLFWFLFTWVSLGLVTGMVSAAAVIFFEPSASMVVIPQEIARAGARLTIIGGLVAFTAELAGGAHRALRDIESQHEDALGHRRHILDRAQARSRLIAEVLHRRVQGRMAAIALLLRMHDRARALVELDAIIDEVLPGLMSSLGGAPEPRPLAALDHPTGIDLRIERGASAQKLFPEYEALAHRLIEEATANAIRHGQATSLTVRIRAEAGYVQITCRDNGTGLSDSITPGLGSRLFDEAVGRDGWWTMSSAPGGGTEVHFALPVETGPAHASPPATDSTLVVVETS